jgi:hypothetical protein
MGTPDDIDISLIVARCRDAGNVSPLIRALRPELSDDVTQFASDHLPLNIRGRDPTTQARHEHIADFILAYDAEKTRRGFDKTAFDSVYPNYKSLPGGRVLSETRAIELAKGHQRPAPVRIILRGRKSRV